MAGLPSWHVGRHARRKTFLFMKADAQGRQGDRHKKLGTSFKMKPNIHPEYRPVAFVDLSINKTFIIPSAVQTRETVEIDGVTTRSSSSIPPRPATPSTRAPRPASLKPAASRSSVRSSPPRSRPSTRPPKLRRPRSNSSAFAAGSFFRRRRAISRSGATRPPHYKRAPTHSPESKKGEPLKT